MPTKVFPICLLNTITLTESPITPGETETRNFSVHALFWDAFGPVPNIVKRCVDIMRERFRGQM